MRSSYTITFEETHVRAVSLGDKNEAFATKLWSDIASMCKEVNCFNVLLLAKSSSSLDTVSMFKFAKGGFREAVSGCTFRIAWAELDEKAQEQFADLETILFNRGLMPGKLFTDADEALRWLLSEAAP